MRKLSVHNLDIYDWKTKEAYCYIIWNECVGNLTGHKFATILPDFTEFQLPLKNGYKKIDRV